jgi:hypothetical protein
VPGRLIVAASTIDLLLTCFVARCTIARKFLFEFPELVDDFEDDASFARIQGDQVQSLTEGETVTFAEIYRHRGERFVRRGY